MKLHMVTSVGSPDKFNAAILQPLRVHTMGSVVVRIKYMTATINAIHFYVESVREHYMYHIYICIRIQYFLKAHLALVL